MPCLPGCLLPSGIVPAPYLILGSEKLLYGIYTCIYEKKRKNLPGERSPSTQRPRARMQRHRSPPSGLPWREAHAAHEARSHGHVPLGIILIWSSTVPHSPRDQLDPRLTAAGARPHRTQETEAGMECPTCRYEKTAAVQLSLSAKSVSQPYFFLIKNQPAVLSTSQISSSEQVVIDLAVAIHCLRFVWLRFNFLSSVSSTLRLLLESFCVINFVAVWS
jgi:hypothetical protein